MKDVVFGGYQPGADAMIILNNPTEIQNGSNPNYNIDNANEALYTGATQNATYTATTPDETIPNGTIPNGTTSDTIRAGILTTKWFPFVAVGVGAIILWQLFKK